MAKKKESAEENGSPGRPRGVRPFWSGTITFGLVSVPVDLFPASRRTRPTLRMLDEDGTPLSRRYYCPADESEVPSEEIVRGYEIEEDEYVIVTDEELEGVQPRKSRDIELQRFVELEEASPIFFERSYFLTPGGESSKAYRLLTEVMEETGRAGIATFVMRSKEYLVAIIAEEGLLRAETLRFAAEVRSPDDVGLPELPEADEEGVKTLVDLIEANVHDELGRDDLVDAPTQQLEALVERKRKKKKDVVQVSAAADDEEAPSDEEDGEASPVDLLESIRRRLRGETPSSDGAGAGGPASLADATKEELYEKAQELELPGRSRMNKQELAAAIREAGS